MLPSPDTTDYVTMYDLTMIDLAEEAKPCQVIEVVLICP